MAKKRMKEKEGFDAKAYNLSKLKDLQTKGRYLGTITKVTIDPDWTGKKGNGDGMIKLQVKIEAGADNPLPVWAENGVTVFPTFYLPAEGKGSDGWQRMCETQTKNLFDSASADSIEQDWEALEGKEIGVILKAYDGGTRKNEETGEFVYDDPKNEVKSYFNPSNFRS